MRDIKAKTAGKWTGILAELGVPRDLLNKKHQPCPFCGGKDRFRYIDKDADGFYLCNQCGSGDGFDLLRRYLKIPMADVFKKVDGMYSGVKSDPPKKTKDNHGALVRVLKIEAVGDKQLSNYFAGRGIDLEITGIPHLKIVKGLRYIHEEKTTNLFAMLAQVLNEKGELTSVHRTYFGVPEGAPKRKLMSPVGTLTGSAIRLYPATNILAVAEGIETAMAIRQLFKGEVPVWACVSAHGLEHVMLPKSVKKVIVCCDNDANFVGQAAGYSLAQTLTREGRSVRVKMPEKIGDWNDVLNERQMKE